MAKGIYVGVGGVARKVNKLYVGVGGVAKKIKKAYVGVDGLARLFYSAGLSKLTTNLTLTMTTMASNTSVNFSSTIGNYALVADRGTVVNAFTTDLVRSTPTYLSVYRNYLVSGANSAYAIFASNDASMDTYSSTLARVASTNITQRRYQGCASSTNYVYISNGEVSGGSNTNSIDCISTGITKSTLYTNYAKMWSSAGCVNNVLFVAGGYISASSIYDSTVEFYTNLVKGTPVSLSTARALFTSASVGNYVLFAGGYGNSSAGKICEVFSSTGVKQTNLTFSTSVYGSTGTSTGEYALFAGGYDNSTSSYMSAVYIVDSNLVIDTIDGLSTARSYLGSAKVGDKVLVMAGSYTGGSYSNFVDAYQI